MSKVIYTSDIHGNETQYKKLVSHVIQVRADFIIIGGDIAPKDFNEGEFIIGQRRFLRNKLPELLSPLKNKLPNCKLFLMMGNDDVMANMDILEKGDGNLYHLIHNKRIKLTDNFDLVGYGCVPITPFGIKDWEKYDFSNIPKNLEAYYEERKRVNYRLKAKKSTKDGWQNFEFTPEIEKQDSIQKDLSDKLFTQNPDKAIYITHVPPDRTNLDIISPFSASGITHVGSMAVRRFIEKYQPFLTLHGHVHETVEKSGKFKHQIGITLCLTSGNHNIGENLAVLVLDLDKPDHAQRIII